MRLFATKVAEILRDLGQLETLAVKVASDKSSQEAQVTQCKASSHLYTVMMKEASQLPEEHPWQQVVSLTEKMAACLDKPELTNEYRAKLAAAVTVDDVLSKQLETIEGEEHTKIATLILYGREYIAELLREALV